KFETPTSAVVRPSKFCSSVVGFGGSAIGSANPRFAGERPNREAAGRPVDGRRTIARPPPPDSSSSSRSLTTGKGGACLTISLNGDDTSLTSGAATRTRDAALIERAADGDLGLIGATEQATATADRATNAAHSGFMAALLGSFPVLV